jgi:transposase
MKKFRTLQDRKQLALLPASVEEYVASDDVVRYVDEMVDLLDLSEIEQKYSYFGRPGYEPRVIVKILVYGVLRGMRSARELERACQENLRFIFLAQNEKPDFRTINLFRREHAKALAGLLRKTVEVGVKEGAITLGSVAVDGTKIRAFAGHRSFHTVEALQAELDELERSYEREFEEDCNRDDKDNDDDDSHSLPPELKDKQQRQDRLKAALVQFEEVEKVKESPAKQLSTTDPDSRFMVGPEGRHPCYNAQAAVDTKSRMVVAGYVTSACSDHGQVKPMLAAINESTDRLPRVLVADKGYGAQDGLVELRRHRVEGYIAQRSIRSDKFVYQRETDRFRCQKRRILKFWRLRGTHRLYRTKTCQGCALCKSCIQGEQDFKTLSVSVHQPLVERMQKRMDTKLGKAMLKLRASTIETVFGHLKYARKLSRFLHRGAALVDSMWKFELAVYNIERIISLRLA